MRRVRACHTLLQSFWPKREQHTNGQQTASSNNNTAQQSTAQYSILARVSSRSRSRTRTRHAYKMKSLKEMSFFPHRVMTKKCVKINYFNVVLMSAQCFPSHSYFLSFALCAPHWVPLCVCKCMCECALFKNSCNHKSTHVVKNTQRAWVVCKCLSQSVCVCVCSCICVFVCLPRHILSSTVSTFDTRA